MSNLLQVVVIFGAFVGVWVWHYKTQRNGEWHSHWSFRRGLVMRRYKKPGGGWLYRDQTDEEANDETLSRW